MHRCLHQNQVEAFFLFFLKSFSFEPNCAFIIEERLSAGLVPVQNEARYKWTS